MIVMMDLLPNDWAWQHVWDVAHIVIEMIGVAWAVGRFGLERFRGAVQEQIQPLREEFREHVEEDRRNFAALRRAAGAEAD